MKNILCINSVGVGMQIAVQNEKQTKFLNLPFAKHSETLFPNLEDVLKGQKLSDFDCFGVVVGPGSFTGIRIGLSVVKTFAFVNKKPIVCVNAFEVLAWSAKDAIKKEQTIVAAMNAGAEQVYFQTFQFVKEKLVKTTEPAVETIKHFEDFLKTLKNKIVISDAKLELKSKVCVVPFDAKALLCAVKQHIESGDLNKSGQIEPLYLRLSQGEVCQVKLDKIDFVPAGKTEKMALFSVDSQFDDFWSTQDWETNFKNKNFVCKQAIFSGTLVGFVAYSIDDKTAEILKVVVSKSAKNQGVAKFMIDSILNEFEKIGVKRVFVKIDSNNIAALNLFLKFGFDNKKDSKTDVVLLKKNI